MGNIRLQLAAARVIIYEFDVAQESRTLSHGELELHRELKAHVLGLASLVRSMARQRVRTRHLQEGDACTRYFHLQACHRRRKNYLLAISHNGQTFTEEEAKADIVFSYYNEILGKPFQRLHRIDLQQLDLPRLDLSELIAPFSAEEVAAIVRETPADRAPGPDGFSGAFYTLQGGVGGGWTRCSAGVPIALGPRLSQLPPPQ